MEKKSFANRFGPIALMSLSLFASTAFAGTAATSAAGAQGPQQVVVTNTPAQPVPVKFGSGSCHWRKVMCLKSA